MTPVETLIALALVVIAFLGGLAVGSLNDPSETPPQVFEVEVPTGDFEDVPLSMTSSSGNTHRYLCDMHFTPTEDTAQCEWIAP